jgi:hypothetical protein
LCSSKTEQLVLNCPDWSFSSKPSATPLNRSRVKGSALADFSQTITCQRACNIRTATTFVASPQY